MARGKVEEDRLHRTWALERLCPMTTDENIRTLKEHADAIGARRVVHFDLCGTVARGIIKPMVARPFLVCFLAVALSVFLVLGGSADADGTLRRPYAWLPDGIVTDTVADRILPPPGYQRVAVVAGSFGDWLRHLPLRPAGSLVHLHDGTLKTRKDVHAAVIDMDVGLKDLQQCADAVIRLRAEHLYSRGRDAAIRFNFTSGDGSAFTRWADGWRPRVSNNRVRWVRSGGTGNGYAAFKAYLETVFIYAGSYSLAKEMERVSDVRSIGPGDVFIQGGFPGHAVIVLDVAEDPAAGSRLMLL